MSLFWLVGSAITRHYLRQVNASHAGALTENVASIRAAWAMLDALWRLQVAIVESPGKDVRETQIEIAELEAVFAGHLQEATDAAFTPEERTQVDIVRDHFTLYRDHIENDCAQPGCGICCRRRKQNARRRCDWLEESRNPVGNWWR